jgi:NitT/TauT family transport system ATP-binding protein
MIEITGLCKTFPGKSGSQPVEALKDFNLTIEDNEFLTVLGPSGCGKSNQMPMIDWHWQW